MHSSPYSTGPICRGRFPHLIRALIVTPKVIHQRRGELWFSPPRPVVNNFCAAKILTCEQLDFREAGPSSESLVEDYAAVVSGALKGRQNWCPFGCPLRFPTALNPCRRCGREWLRGLDLNQRPSEHPAIPVPVCRTGIVTGG